MENLDIFIGNVEEQHSPAFVQNVFEKRNFGSVDKIVMIKVGFYTVATVYFNKWNTDNTQQIRNLLKRGDTFKFHYDDMKPDNYWEIVAYPLVEKMEADNKDLYEKTQENEERENKCFEYGEEYFDEDDDESLLLSVSSNESSIFPDDDNDSVNDLSMMSMSFLSQFGDDDESAIYPDENKTIEPVFVDVGEMNFLETVDLPPIGNSNNSLQNYHNKMALKYQRSI